MSGLDVLLIYPQLGAWDNLVRDMPLSLIYAATDTVKKGYKVQILDLRVHGEQWQEEVDKAMAGGCRLVGLSVMTGNPIITSLLVSRYVKERYEVPIVWGGPHPTILPEQTLSDPAIDYVIRDWGSLPLSQLTDVLVRGEGSLSQVVGLGYKEEGRLVLNEVCNKFEMLDFRDLPYHLIPMDGKTYNRLNNEELIFPIYTSMGCPYKCTFCMAPAQYEKISGKKWVAYDEDEVIEHIAYLDKTFTFTRLQIYDDESFVDRKRMERLLQKYVARGFHKKYKIDFRGARISDLDKVEDSFLQLLSDAGVELMFIGIESGSPRVLEMMKKSLKVEQVIRVNRRLANFPNLKQHYNFFCGIPGEQFEDLVLTKELFLQLVKDNPRCYIGSIGPWKPIPGTVLSDIATREYGYALPVTLEGWAKYDMQKSITIDYPWFTKDLERMMRLLQVAGLVLDGKAKDFHHSLGWLLGRIVYAMVLLYRQIFLLRMRYNFTALFFEHTLIKFAERNFGKLIKLAHPGSWFQKEETS